MELGWGGRQVLDNGFGKRQRAESQLVAHSPDAFMEHLKNEKPPTPARVYQWMNGQAMV